MEPEPVLLVMTTLVLLLTGVEQTSSSWLVKLAKLPLRSSNDTLQRGGGLVKRSAEEDKACIDDSDCVDLGHKYSCFLYSCHNWVDPSPAHPHCQADWNCPEGNKCFRHWNLREVDHGICFTDYQVSVCSKHTDCRTSDYCCGMYCCPPTFYKQWTQFSCFSDMQCRSWKTGKYCCNNNLCCDDRKIEIKIPAFPTSPVLPSDLPWGAGIAVQEEAGDATESDTGEAEEQAVNDISDNTINVDDLLANDSDEPASENTDDHETEPVQDGHNNETAEQEASDALENVVLAEHDEHADEDQPAEADISQVLAETEVDDFEDSTTETLSGETGEEGVHATAEDAAQDPVVGAEEAEDAVEDGIEDDAAATTEADLAETETETNEMPEIDTNTDYLVNEQVPTDLHPNLDDKKDVHYETISENIIVMNVSSSEAANLYDDDDDELDDEGDHEGDDDDNDSNEAGEDLDPVEPSEILFQLGSDSSQVNDSSAESDGNDFTAGGTSAESGTSDELAEGEVGESALIDDAMPGSEEEEQSIEDQSAELHNEYEEPTVFTDDDFEVNQYLAEGVGIIASMNDTDEQDESNSTEDDNMVLGLNTVDADDMTTESTGHRNFVNLRPVNFPVSSSAPGDSSSLRRAVCTILLTSIGQLWRGGLPARSSPFM